MNRALPSLHGGSLEITLTLPLSNIIHIFQENPLPPGYMKTVGGGASANSFTHKRPIWATFFKDGFVGNLNLYPEGMSLEPTGWLQNLGSSTSLTLKAVLFFSLVLF